MGRGEIQRTNDGGLALLPLRRSSFAFRPSSRPSISAIITGYNYARFLPAAIESVLSQTVVPDEIVVVDDGSTDNTAEVVARYASRGVRYVCQPNRGAGSARNLGIRETSGELIAFLDGDDRWLPYKTSVQLAHFAANPSVGLVTGSEIQVLEDGAVSFVLVRNPVGVTSFYPRILIENTVGNPSLAMVRRECFERVGLFDESLPLGQDWDMWIRIARRFAVGVVDACLIHFTRHSGSLTAGKVSSRHESNSLIARRYISPVRPLPRRFRLRLGARSMSHYYAAAELASTPGMRGLALAHALAAFVFDPAYEAKKKAALLFRTALGSAAFGYVAALVPRRRRTQPGLS